MLPPPVIAGVRDRNAIPWLDEEEVAMKRFLTAFAALATAAATLAVGPAAATPGGSLWSASVPFTNVVASSPTTGGGYPVPPGSRVPVAGTCREGPFNANHSESWLAVKPGTEDLVGSS